MKKKCIAISIVVVMLCGIYTIANAVNMSDLQTEKEKITQELNEANQGLENIQIELTEALEAINKIEAQIIEGETKLQETKTEIAKLEEEIKQAKEKLEYIQKDYDAQKEALENRLVALYEMGEATYLDVLLNSKNITDFISRYYLIGEIAQYDNDLLETIEREKNKIEEISKQLSEKNETLKIAKNTQEKTLIALENARTIKNSYAAELTEEELNTQKQIEEYNSKLDSIDAQMLFLAMGDGSTEFIGGEFAWPAPGFTTITSPFGMRFHPILHYYRMHNGIDIATPTGTLIVASNSGIVTTASYVGSYGNVVMIDHGGGVTSAYAHGSEIVAKVGQKVEKGDVILKAGSTGLSTGPHLHFEICVNGKYVNPLPYVTNSN
ncbi:MAG: peptidoglycan DD-metalloendopeptidase family protein [Clostridia bacterium]|nr:peptidoglycan DD-metalloendopeptidase family protein [Clostridia bacterium]